MHTDDTPRQTPTPAQWRELMDALGRIETLLKAAQAKGPGDGMFKVRLIQSWWWESRYLASMERDITMPFAPAVGMLVKQQADDDVDARVTDVQWAVAEGLFMVTLDASRIASDTGESSVRSCLNDAYGDGWRPQRHAYPAFDADREAARRNRYAPDQRNPHVAIQVGDQWHVVKATQAIALETYSEWLKGNGDGVTGK